METGIQMETFRSNGNDRTTHLSDEQATASNGDGAVCRTNDATDSDGLSSVQVVRGNGDGVNDARETDELLSNQTAGFLGNRSTPRETSSLCRLKEELDKVVFWRVKLWMVIVFIFFLIVAAITVSLVVCSVIQVDPDENFDLSLFKVPLHFSGRFQLPNLVFKEELLTLSSNESQALAANLQQKISDLYRASPALGRYFSKAEIFAFRNGSVIAGYQLTFLMPEEQQDQLRNFTLSREVVYNVFRQFLYDQELDESQQMYIDPVSLNMFLAHQ